MIGPSFHRQNFIGQELPRIIKAWKAALSCDETGDAGTRRYIRISCDLHHHSTVAAAALVFGYFYL